MPINPQQIIWDDVQPDQPAAVPDASAVAWDSESAAPAKPEEPPIIIAAVRPGGSPRGPAALKAAGDEIKPQEVDPSVAVAGFDGEVQADAQYHTALSDADKAEYRQFFKDPKSPPSAAVLRQWYHAKTGALLGNADQIVEAFKKTGKFQTNEKIAIPKPKTSAAEAYFDHTANAAVADYGPEAAAVLATLGIGGDGPNIWNADDQSLGNLWANNADLLHARLDAEQEQHPWASPLGELTGVAVDAPLGGVAADAAGLGKLGRAAVTSAESAAYGSGAAGPGNRGEGAATGAALGAATEAAAAGLAARSAAKAAAKTANSEFGQAAARQGIDYMAADLPKSMKSKFATALSNLTLGGIPLAEQGERNIGTVANAVERIAGNMGSVADKTAAGQAAQRGARQFVDQSGAMLDTLESKIPIPANAPAVVGSTRSALTGLAQSFSSNPKLAAAFRDPKISAYLDALTPQSAQEATGVLDAAGNPVMRDVTHGGGLSWNDLRDFRTRVGQIIGQPGLTSDGAQIGQLRALYGALSDDIRQTARGYGPQAEKSWSRWNNYARARANRIENVVSLIVGKSDDRGAQSAFEALQRLASDKGGDPIKLAQALRSMPADEASSVRATILDELGKASAGQQNAAGDVFSPAQFVSQWNKLSDRAKNILFTGEHRAAIDDVVKVVSGMKASAKFANTSKTGIGVVASTHTIPMLIANPVVGALDMALQYGSGKLLASPAFARKLAATPLNEAGARAFWSRPWVKALQVKNPAIAAEIQAFQHAFLSHANDNSAILSAASAEADGQQQQQ